VAVAVESAEKRVKAARFLLRQAKNPHPQDLAFYARTQPVGCLEGGAKRRLADCVSDNEILLRRPDLTGIAFSQFDCFGCCWERPEQPVVLVIAFHVGGCQPSGPRSWIDNL
jgi:hypothetical protein